MGAWARITTLGLRVANGTRVAVRGFRGGFRGVIGSAAFDARGSVGGGGRGGRVGGGKRDAAGPFVNPSLSQPGGTYGPVMGYDAAKTGRMDADYNPPPVDINIENGRDLPKVWAKVRHLTANDPYIKAARDLTRRNTVGRGILPVLKSGNDAVDAEVNDLLVRAAKGVDRSRKIELAASQGQFFDEYWTAGEVGVDHPIVSAFRGFAKGPAIDVIDTSDRMPLGKSERVSVDSKAFTAQGVEYNAEGQEVAYHLAKPNLERFGMVANAWNTSVPALETERMPAERMTFSVHAIRRGQVRGTPWPVAVVWTLRNEDRFLEAMLAVEQVRACIALLLETTTPIGAPGTTTTPGLSSIDGKPISDLYPGMVGFVPPGSKVHTMTPAVQGQTLETIDKTLLRRVAAGLGLGYGELSRDRTASTFSSDRADKLESEALYREFQSVIWSAHTKPWAIAVIRWAILTGTMSRGAAAAFAADPEMLRYLTPMYPGRKWIDPVKEVQANTEAISSGITTLEAVCAETGSDWRDVLKQRAMEQAEARALEEKYGLDRGSLTAGAKPQQQQQQPKPQQGPGGGEDTAEDDAEDGAEDSNQNGNQNGDGGDDE